MIQLRAAEKRFGETVALHPTDLCFTSGQVTVLIGPSGCGKSTLLRLIAGLEEPTSGFVEFDGRRVGKASVLALRRRMGYVIQEGGLFPHLTAGDNVLLMARHLKRPAIESRARLDWLCELTCLRADSLRRYPLELSGGERQRVSLMRALMLDPEVLLLDEPLGALDPIMRLALENDLKGIFARLKKTVVMVTHDVAEAAFLADAIVVLRRAGSCRRGPSRSAGAANARLCQCVPVRAAQGGGDMSRAGWRGLLVGAAVVCSFSQAAAEPLRIGSKRFTESYVLGRSPSASWSSPGCRRSTARAWAAPSSCGARSRQAPSISTRTTQARCGGDPEVGPHDRRRDARGAGARGVGVTGPLGFNNRYALVMRRSRAAALGLERISDLARHPELRVGLTHEFLERRDGWKPLAAHYGLTIADVRGIEHAVAYAALASDAIDLMDAYSTDARLARTISPCSRTIAPSSRATMRSSSTGWASIRERSRPFAAWRTRSTRRA